MWQRFPRAGWTQALSASIELSTLSQSTMFDHFKFHFCHQTISLQKRQFANVQTIQHVVKLVLLTTRVSSKRKGQRNYNNALTLGWPLRPGGIVHGTHYIQRLQPSTHWSKWMADKGRRWSDQSPDKKFRLKSGKRLTSENYFFK